MKAPLSILAALLAVSATLAQEAPARRPNIVFLFSDDHAYQAVSAYGHRLNQTPHIDRLAREGMRFDRCLVPNSLCGPSRATILTGKYNHLNGFYNNTNSRFDSRQTTFPKLLQKAGYQTAIVGKWHLVSAPTGFDFWEILPGQGQYYNPPMIRKGRNVKHEGYVTDVITDRALDWLKNKRDADRPFVLMVQHKAPHREWEPSLKHLALNDGVRFPEPRTLFDDYSGRGIAEKTQDMTIAHTMTAQDLKLTPPRSLTAEQRKVWDAYYEPRNAAFRKAKLEGKELVRWKYQRYLHDYFACIASVDDSVGRILDYLKEAGLERNTLVVYSSDQGFFLGEHGWFDKRWIFEESLRTPLLVRWPGVVKAGSVNRDIVSNLDFAETFLEAAGVPVPKEMQGHSLLPLLQGKTPAHWRKSFYYHYYEYPGPHSVRRHYGVVTDRYKLVHFYEPDVDSWELFDRQNDHDELRSVFGKPEYAQVQKDLEAELKRLRAELKVPDHDPPESVIGPARKTSLPPADRKPPNIVFILADDLGYGDLGCYGQRRIKTPCLDQLAHDGMRFTQCYAGSTVCAPSRCCLMTGKHTGHAVVRGNTTVPVTDTTVAEVLKKAGYRTALVGKWGLGEPGTPGLPTRRGFDSFFGYLNQNHAHNYYPDYLWHNEGKAPIDGNVVKRGVASKRSHYSPDLLTREALAFLEQNKDRPFFLYLAHTLPHANNEKGSLDGNGMEVPDAGIYRDESWPAPQKNHAAMITYLDSEIGKVLGKLKELGLEENTVVFFSSDNGPHKEGGADPAFFHSGGPLRGFKRDLTEGGIRVPLIVRWPGKVKAGAVSDQVWAFWDFLPTAAEVAGVQPPKELDGISVLPTLLGRGEQKQHRFLYWEFHERGSQFAVRMGKWKAIRLALGAPLKLYDLSTDLHEDHDVAAQNPEVVARIEDYLKTARTESKDFPLREPPGRRKKS